MAVCGNQTDIREADRTLKAQLVTTKWLIKTSTVTIDVRGYSDEIYACVSWPEWFEHGKTQIFPPLTAPIPHFALGTINIKGADSETTDFVWYTLMNTVRWWCRNKEWVKLAIEPDDDYTTVVPRRRCEFVDSFHRSQRAFVTVPSLLGGRVHAE